jgi:acyl-CoA synthetase (AMP-forming)/AMP-acid ligase II
MSSRAYPREHARTSPDKPAVIIAETGQILTYGTLESRANQLAHVWRQLGLVPGDVVAILLENTPRWFELYWSAQRSGLYVTPLAVRLTAGEVAYIVNDSNSKVVVTSALCPAAAELVRERAALIPGVTGLFWLEAPVEGAEDLAALADTMPDTPIAAETAGFHMTYSSGTTGKPKGIKLPLSGGPADADIPMVQIIQRDYGVGPDTIYLSPAPLYHTAPLMFCTAVQRLGGVTVVMQHFEPEAFLQAVERYKATFTQLVPTMFVRMLKLPDDVRTRYDLSSLQIAVHAAAPCPVPVKRQMLQWWGPIIHEYYAGSEANGGTKISPEEWLRKPGSVGRPSWGKVHVCEEDGNELPAGETGAVYFEGGLDFQYHNAPEKTHASRNPRHPTWSSMGDIGYLDEEGYLFLTDRKAFMIISGGVNIYPQETEDVLIVHPKVADAAVFGVPNPDFGEEVKAVVQPARWEDAGPALAQELIDYCRSKLSPLKCPRSVDFEQQLPRAATGKLFKKPLRDRYWQGRPA